MSGPLSQIGLRTTALRDNVRVFTLGSESIATSYGANCTAVAGRESVLLVDPLIAPACARHIEGAIASWTPLPIRFVLLTHHHTDHALGAGYFASRGATVVAHAACRDRWPPSIPRRLNLAGGSRICPRSSPTPRHTDRR